MKFFFFFLLLLFQFHDINATVLYVTNTNDSGAGSLREKVSLCNDYDMIRFNHSLIASGSVNINLLSTFTLPTK